MLRPYPTTTNEISLPEESLPTNKQQTTNNNLALSEAEGQQPTNNQQQPTNNQQQPTNNK